MTITVDPTAPAFRYDALPLFDRLLREQPVTPLVGGGVLLCRHQDVAWALTSHDVRRPTEWSVNRKPEGPFRDFGRNNMISMNPPDHTRFRQAIMPAFSRKRTDAMTRFIETTCDRLIDDMRTRSSGDFIRDFAMPLPVTVICELLGIPTEEEDMLRIGSADMLAGLEIVASPEEFVRASAGARALFDYLSGVVREREHRLGDDLLSLLIRNERDHRLSRDEIVWAAITLLIAGHETTTHLLGNGLLALVRHPEAFAALRANPDLATNAVEEFLRYDPPLYVLFRQAARDFEIDGTGVAEGTLIMLSIAAANRDPRHFDEPDRLDLTRTNARDNLSFAAGRHLCAGHALARLEGQVAFRRLAERLTDVRLAEEPSPREGVMFKGYHTLPMAYCWAD
ncbi:MAG: cytochrome P450 [Pseudomonadales bacterium]|nr:cytochrome P450 [Pseudomonadales bacterium]